MTLHLPREPCRGKAAFCGPGMRLALKSLLLSAAVALLTAMRIGEMTAVYYKNKYLRVRASTIEPGLMPPFGPPGHPSFPSGHSTQGWLISYALGEATWSASLGQSIYKNQLEWLADRVATNRERAGLHYHSDSQAGQFLANAVFTLLKANNNNYYPLFAQALTDGSA